MNQDIFVVIEHRRGQIADITYVALAQAQALAKETGGKVVALLLGNNASGLAKNLAADSAWTIDQAALAEFASEAYGKVLAGVIKEKSPRAVLLGDTTVGAELAGLLSARLGLPLITSCLRVGAGKYMCKICGGKMMVEGDLPAETVLVAMIPGSFKVEQGQSAKGPEVTPLPAPDLSGLRVTFKQYIEPQTGDIDITVQKVLVGIGRGIERQDNLELANELAEALGGAVCASRPVVDQGWLPTSRLVGKSGKTVKPKLYLACGISGAPEHAETITGSEMIIAVNTDPAAPIFGMAKYGTEVNMLDLMPALSEAIRKIKGG
ncbi:MAG TPA: electron transfer flavoprotein subunit alpha/FixB family protein [Thermodesulfobacteriota bacterium]|nr:electron transfer flavoprotein subunit alpha/FixB family protein [Thermodesulfobacteriota bacterium]